MRNIIYGMREPEEKWGIQSARGEIALPLKCLKFLSSFDEAGKLFLIIGKKILLSNQELD